MPQLSIDEAMTLALQHCQRGQLQHAEMLYRQVLSLQPDHHGALHQLGVLLQQRGLLDQAAECYRQALRANPKSAATLCNLGRVLHSVGRFDESEGAYRQAIALQPDAPDAYSNLGSLLRQTGRGAEAVECCGRAIALRGNFATAHFNLANALRDLNRADEAIGAYRQTLALRPDHAMALCNLGNVLRDNGDIEDAVECHRRASALRPDRPELHSALLHTLQYDPDITSAQIAVESRRWAEMHASAFQGSHRPHINDRSPDRPLRVGYLSTHLCTSSVSVAVEALLANHDRRQFQIVCYAELNRCDDAGERIMSLGHVWRDIAGLSDEQLVELIIEDQIDVLLDLTLHMGNNRLLTFARKPAPVQLSYAGYNGTTGLTSMDYRLTDPFIHPPGNTVGEAEGPEQLAYLPDCYWCHAPYPELPLNELPAQRTGRVTFASLNNFSKINRRVLSVWADLLRASPQATLLIVAPGGPGNQHVWRLLEQTSVDRSRVTLVGRTSYFEYWKLYERIDVALDPFPFNGGITTLDCLWMGVPVVTLAGQRAVGRAGVSILSNLELAELIAQTPEGYVRIARDLTNNLPHLADLRRTLRDRMRTSPLMDGPRFARNAEAVYRQMWRAWCLQA